jgi:hypothetical protein
VCALVLAEAWWEQNTKSQGKFGRRVQTQNIHEIQTIVRGRDSQSTRPSRKKSQVNYVKTCLKTMYNIGAAVVLCPLA